MPGRDGGGGGGAEMGALEGGGGGGAVRPRAGGGGGGAELWWGGGGGGPPLDGGGGGGAGAGPGDKESRLKRLLQRKGKPSEKSCPNMDTWSAGGLTLPTEFVFDSFHSSVLLNKVVDDLGGLLVFQLSLIDAANIEQVLQLRVQVIQLQKQNDYLKRVTRAASSEGLCRHLLVM